MRYPLTVKISSFFTQHYSTKQVASLEEAEALGERMYRVYKGNRLVFTSPEFNEVWG